MFTPKYVKESRMLLKGVRKFLNYKRDILPPKKLAEIEEQFAAFSEAVKAKDREKIEEEGRGITRLCEKAVPAPGNMGIRENVEVFFVAIVIALGIRAYFLQPFKIPTGSMQPTLNGIIATPLEDVKKASPNLFKRGAGLVLRGRNYVDVVAKKDFTVTRIHQVDKFKFFSFTYIEREGGLRPIKIWSPLRQAVEDLGLGAALGGGSFSQDQTEFVGIQGRKISAGTVLARGYVDTGDQVLVDKFSYHFRRPRRGEVFVFTTKGIDLIKVDPRMGSQHYIKRLGAVPGDTLEIKEPKLFINGEEAKEKGFQRVMSQKDGYRGYQVDRHARHRNLNKVTLGEKEYMALGDNSFNSFDSRGWGTVPQRNLVGPALVVYWPFISNWGKIR